MNGSTAVAPARTASSEIFYRSRERAFAQTLNLRFPFSAFYFVSLLVFQPFSFLAFQCVSFLAFYFVGLSSFRPEPLPYSVFASRRYEC